VWSLEVVVRLEGKRLDSCCEVMGPGKKVQGAVEGSAVPLGDDTRDAGVWGDLGVGEG